jgi:hypothetical protein
MSCNRAVSRHRYLAEAMFRYNNQGTNDNSLSDADRLDLAERQIVGERVTYAELMGRVGEPF